MQLTRFLLSKNFKEIWHKIGVFGTLKSGLPNHYRMQSKCNGLSKFVCNAISKDKYPLVVSSRAMVPFILNKKGAGHNIHFEIYEVDSQMKIFLDKFENVGVLYVSCKGKKGIVVLLK